jgi:hypothetical protein
MLRTSERGTQKRCEFEWYISYVRQVRMGPRGPALRFGALVHQALAQYYIKGTRRGKNPVRTFEKLYDQDVIDNESRFGWRLDGDDKWQEARDIGVGMLGLYLETYLTVCGVTGRRRRFGSQTTRRLPRSATVSCHTYKWTTRQARIGHTALTS